MKGFDSLAKLGKKTQPSQPQRSLHSSLFEPFFVRHMRLMGLIPWKSKDQWGSPAAGAGAAGAAGEPKASPFGGPARVVWQWP